MRTTAGLLVLAVAAALSGCTEESSDLGAPAPQDDALPGVAPVDDQVVQSELQRAVAAMETRRTAEGSYTRNVNDLVEHGFTSGKVLVRVPYADEDGYCIEATSSTDTGLVFHASGATAAHVEGRCPTESAGS